MYSYSATVVRWVDGDTVDLHVDLGFHLFAELRFRLYGIDTPERGQKNHDEAWHLAQSLAPVGAPVFIKTEKDADKYGRWLVEIDNSNVNVNQKIVEAGLAVAYFGGTKGVIPTADVPLA
jgi:micrococcal nuclease